MLQSHEMTIACSPRVKHVIFPNLSSNNCTFTICFETGKWLFSSLVGKVQTVLKSAIFPSQNRRWMYNLTRRVAKRFYFSIFAIKKPFLKKMHWWIYVLLFISIILLDLYLNSCGFFQNLNVYLTKTCTIVLFKVLPIWSYDFFPSLWKFVDSIPKELRRLGGQQWIKPIVDTLFWCEPYSSEGVLHRPQQMVVRRGKVWAIRRVG